MRKFFFLFLIVGCIPAKEKHEFDYTPFARSVIHLSFPNDLPDTISIGGSVFTNIPPGWNETRKLSVVRSGEYYVDIEIDRPAKSVLNIGNEQFNIFIFPRTPHTSLSSHLTVNSTLAFMEVQRI